MDPLAKAYLKVITESNDDLQKKDQQVTGSTLKVGAPFGNQESETNSKKFISKSGPDAKGAETLEKAQEADSDLSVSGEVDGKAKPLATKYEAKNPFDALFNKIISEEGEMMDFSTSSSPEDSTFEPSFDSSDEDSDEFGEGEGDGEGEKVTLEIDRDLAEKLVEILTSVLGDGEGEDGESEMDETGGEEYDDQSEGDEEESFEGGAKPFGEAVDAEDQGHALVDQEKLNHGLNSKGKIVVKGAVPVTKKTAQTPATGKGHDGKLKAHSTEGGISKLTGKDNKVGGVTVGKTIYDQN
jgi:hypothetical protein